MNEVTNGPVPPIKPTWILLAITWVLFLAPIPGLGIIGWVVNLAAFIMAIVVMTRGAAGTGVIQMVCAVVMSPIVYFIGLAVWGATMG